LETESALAKLSASRFGGGAHVRDPRRRRAVAAGVDARLATLSLVWWLKRRQKKLVAALSG
jgi:hypothetical protein